MAEPDAADSRQRLTIPVYRRMPMTRKVRDIPVALGLSTLEELEEELFGYVDVLLGRQEPPIDNGIMTMMEVADGYLARAYEIEMMILAAERNKDILRSNPYVKFRTGELRSFIELARKATDLGSRRLTMARLEHDMKGDAGMVERLLNGMCECDWKNCGHKGREYPAADHGSVRTSPEYCMACLYVCCAERDDEKGAGI